jgi:hypothetical protein
MAVLTAAPAEAADIPWPSTAVNTGTPAAIAMARTGATAEATGTAAPHLEATAMPLTGMAAALGSRC